MAAKSFFMFGVALAAVVAVVSAAPNDTVTYSDKVGNATALSVPVAGSGNRNATTVATNTAVTTTAESPSNATVAPVEVKTMKTMKTIRCYECFFFMRGTNREGSEACEFIDPLIREPEAGIVKCNGYCVKQIMTKNALTSYMYVSRRCQPECTEGSTPHYGNDLVTTCCTDDYCNAATTTTAAAMATGLATAVAILSAWF